MYVWYILKHFGSKPRISQEENTDSYMMPVLIRSSFLLLFSIEIANATVVLFLHLIVSLPIFVRIKYY
jgi:hypothetical protein